MTRRIAIVKPDHIGDLILAAPAIGWLASQSLDATLFVPKSNLALARYLFPTLPIEAMDFGYLSKNAGSVDGKSLQQTLAPARGRDMVVFLRSDHVLNRERTRHLVGPCAFTDSNNERHETINHRAGVRVYFGDYKSDDTWAWSRRPFPRKPKTVGLCLGSGFPTNKWSIIRWTELGHRLMKSGVDLRLIGGPMETNELAILGETLGLEAGATIRGGSDIGAFVEAVAQTDVVIATDGGAGHLCSLATPILTIAASVPFRRFAPYGAANRVISLDLPCSPCMNAHDTHVNLCFSHECSYGVTVDHVLSALDADAVPSGSIRLLGQGARLYFGLSHAG